MGLTAAVIVLGFALATRAASLAPNTPSLVPILLGLIVPGFVAMRDELLFRGLVLRVLPNGTPAPLALFACGLSSAAAAVGTGDVSVPLILTAALGGIALGALWRHDRGAWLAWGAHTSWLWASQSLASGGLIDLRAARTLWGGGDRGLGNGWCAVVATALVAVCTVAYTRAQQRKLASQG